MSQLEETFYLGIKHATIAIPEPIREFKFHPDRRWRSDFAWPDQKILVEIEGGLWVYGRHNRAASMQKDMEKYNAAAELGYRVFRFSGDHVKTLMALETMERVFDAIQS